MGFISAATYAAASKNAGNVEFVKAWKGRVWREFPAERHGRIRMGYDVGDLCGR